MDLHETARQLDRLIENMIARQRAKIRGIADRLAPRATDDDLLQPHDIPELARSPQFQFEDGTLSGYLAAQMALRAWFRDRG